MKRVEMRKGKSQKDGGGKGEKKELKRRGRKNTSRVGKKREERAGGIRVNKNRINSRFNSLKRDPISTITVKLRAIALKETT